MFKVIWFANQIHNFPRCISCGKEITKEPRGSKEKLKNTAAQNAVKEIQMYLTESKKLKSKIILV